MEARRNPHPLLELQRCDQRADQLRRHRAALPERAALADREAEAASVASARSEKSQHRLRLERETQRLDGEATQVEHKARDVERTLYSGTIRAPRELEAFQEELRMLRRRQTALEDEELGVMEESEAAEKELARLAQRGAELDREVAGLRAAIGLAETEIDGELERITQERDVLASRVSEPDLAVYTKLRQVPQLGGVAVATLHGSSCAGCKLVIPLADLGRIRRERSAELTRCPHCVRILVP